MKRVDTYVGKLVDLETNLKELLAAATTSTQVKAEVAGILTESAGIKRAILNFQMSVRPAQSLVLTRKDVPFVWTPAHEDAFQAIRQWLSEDPVVAYPRVREKFYLGVDSSTAGTDAVLEQKRGDSFVAVAYYSKIFSPAQRRYTTTERECLE